MVALPVFNAHIIDKLYDLTILNKFGNRGDIKDLGNLADTFYVYRVRNLLARRINNSADISSGDRAGCHG